MITINAGQSTSFPRIADAIEAAKAYAPMPVTIHIAPGRYPRKLIESHSLTLHLWATMLQIRFLHMMTMQEKSCQTE